MTLRTLLKKYEALARLDELAGSSPPGEAKEIRRRFKRAKCTLHEVLKDQLSNELFVDNALFKKNLKKARALIEFDSFCRAAKE